MSIICQSFMQNAWRKDLCSNCFKLQSDHQQVSAKMSEIGLRSPLTSGRYIPQATAVYQTRNLLCPWKTIFNDQKDWVEKALFSETSSLSSNNDKNSLLDLSEEMKEDVKGILKTKNAVKKKASVIFTESAPLVIGFGGVENFGDDPSWGSDDDEEIDLESLDSTEDERKMTKLTLLNTEFNSDNKNLVVEKVENPPKTKPLKSTPVCTEAKKETPIKLESRAKTNGSSTENEFKIKENSIYSSGNVTDATNEPKDAKKPLLNQESLVLPSPLAPPIETTKSSTKIEEESPLATTKEDKINYLQKLSNGYATPIKEPKVNGSATKNGLAFGIAPDPAEERPSNVNNHSAQPTKVTWSKLAETSKKTSIPNNEIKPEKLAPQPIIQESLSKTDTAVNGIDKSKANLEESLKPEIRLDERSHIMKHQKEPDQAGSIKENGNLEPSGGGKSDLTQKPRIPMKPALTTLNLDRYKTKEKSQPKESQKDKSSLNPYAVSSPLDSSELSSEEVKISDKFEKVIPYAEANLLQSEHILPEHHENKSVNRESKLAALALELEQVRCNNFNKKHAPTPPKEISRSVPKEQTTPSDKRHPILTPRESLSNSIKSFGSDSTQNSKHHHGGRCSNGSVDPPLPKSKKNKFSLKKLLKRSKDYENTDMSESYNLPHNPKAWKQSDFDRMKLKLEIIHPMDIENARDSEHNEKTLDSGFVSLEATSDSDKKCSDFDSPSDDSSNSSHEGDDKNCSQPSAPPRGKQIKDQTDKGIISSQNISPSSSEQNLFYENLGDIRSYMAPKKPDRSFSTDSQVSLDKKPFHATSTNKGPQVEVGTPCIVTKGDGEDPPKPTLASPTCNGTGWKVWLSLENSYAVVSAANHEVLAKLLEKISADKIAKKTWCWKDFRLEPLSASLPNVDLKIFNGSREDSNFTLLVQPLTNHDAPLPVILNKFPLLNHFTTQDAPGGTESSVFVITQSDLMPLSNFNINKLEATKRSPDSYRQICFTLLQSIQCAIQLQAQGIKTLSSDLNQLVLTRPKNDCVHYVLFLGNNSKAELMAPPQFLLNLMRHLLQTSNIEEASKCSSMPHSAFKILLTVAKLLQQDKSFSLSQSKNLLEFYLWGPSADQFGVKHTSAIPDLDNVLQRWLDTERAKHVKVLVKMLCKPEENNSLTLFEEQHMLFLLRTSTRCLRECSLKL